MKLLEDVRVPMRDGPRLATDIMLPQGEGPFPVILTRTPYGKNRFSVSSPENYVDAGYAFVAQDCRGRYRSEGDWFPFVNEARDGHDAIEWIAEQPWSNGRVGMIGGSYQGIVQWAAASTHPPHLSCMIPQETPVDLYGDMVYRSGVLQLVTFYPWALYVDGPGGRECESPPDLTELFRTLPLTDADRAAGHSVPYWKEWLRRPRYDEFWEPQNYKTAIADLSIPVLNIEGWFDMYSPSALESFAALRTQGRTAESREAARAILGPWFHGVWCAGKGSRRCGDLDFGEDAELDVRGVELRFFDRHLKQVDNGLDSEPPLSVFVMGSNRWLHASHWPLPETQWRRAYLHSQGQANSAAGDGVLSFEEPGDEPGDQFTYDPHDPVPTAGGPHSGNAAGGSKPVPAGPLDQRSIEQRQDVLVYTTVPLENDLDIIGPVSLRLTASSSAPDTDFTGKLVDVHPDGRAIILCEGILRASYRDSNREPSPIVPGKAYALTIDLGTTANCFRRGHCIRLEVSSSNFPRYSRNLNTGADSGQTAETAVAHQTVYHERGRASWVELPVVESVGS